MKNHLLILLLLVFTLSCTGQKMLIATYDKKMAIIKNPKCIKWITGKDFEMWKLEKVDLSKVNDILIDAINNNEFYFLKSKNISELKKNYRQYPLSKE